MPGLLILLPGVLLDDGVPLFPLPDLLLVLVQDLLDKLVRGALPLGVEVRQRRQQVRNLFEGVVLGILLEHVVEQGGDTLKVGAAHQRGLLRPR